MSFHSRNRLPSRTQEIVGVANQRNPGPRKIAWLVFSWVRGRALLYRPSTRCQLKTHSKFGISWFPLSNPLCFRHLWNAEYSNTTRMLGRHVVVHFWSLHVCVWPPLIGHSSLFDWGLPLDKGYYIVIQLLFCMKWTVSSHFLLPCDSRILRPSMWSLH